MKYVNIAIAVVLGVVALLFLLLIVAVLRTVFMGRKKSEYIPAPDESRVKEYSEKLSEMIKIPTVSHKGQTDISEYLKLHEKLEQLFPTVHEKLEKTVIDGNLLYRWEGKSHENPIVLMSHHDVVPAEGVWEHEPFSGDIADGKVWGRGAGDTKCSVMSFFQAVEELLKDGYVPQCDVYLASSCTEEWGGDGGPKLVAELKRRGVKPFLVCDEGGGIISEPVGGIKGNYAMVGVFEKGHANLKFTARSNGGHASTPPRNTPIVRLAAFINEVESGKHFKKKFLPEVTAMFGRLSRYAPFGLRLVMGNLWYFKPLMKAVMPAISSQAGAMLRTTVAFTMQSGSDAENVLPQEATLCANVRYIPHQGEKKTLKVLGKLARKYDLEMEVLNSGDYSKPADINGKAFKMVEKTIEQTFPGLAYSPYVVLGATDARFYQEICDNCVRFAPVIYGPEQMKGMHGLNENIECACIPGAVDFYKNLIKKQEENNQ